MSTWENAQFFLEGNWKNGKSYLKFTKSADKYKVNTWRSSYNLPYFNYGDYYNIVDGNYRLEKKDSEEYRNMYHIRIISYDCIEVFAYKNSQTYTLYRQ